MKTKDLLFISLLVCALGAFSSNVNYRFRTMSPEGGFYYDGVKEIEQDQTGFIWVMMDYELYRYDGYHYKKYYPYFAKLQPTRKWFFKNMASDSSGCLYINTNNGIYRYESVTDRFEWIYDPVSTIMVDNMDHLWVRVQTLWHQLNVITGELSTPLYDGKKIDYSNVAFCSYHQNLYSFVRQRIYRYNYTKKQFNLCYVLPDTQGNIRFAQACKGSLWVFVDRQGLYQIDLTTFRVKKRFKPLSEYDGAFLNSFYVDNEEQVWMGTMDGVYILDTKDGQLSHYKHSRSDPFSLPNNSIWEIFGDKQSNVWIGMYSGKLCCVDVNESNAFRSWMPETGGLNNAPVSAFAEDGNNLWIGTEGGGLNQMDVSTGQIMPFVDKGKTSLSNVKSLVLDNERRLWIATFKEGLAMYDIRRGDMTHYRHDKNDKQSLLVNDIRKIVQEADSGLWIAYQHSKPVVSYFSFQTRSFVHYELGDNTNYLFDIQRQGENKLWGISNEALYCMDVHTKKVEKIMPNDSIYLGLFTSCLDDSGNIWIGTIGNGLVKFDTNSLQFMNMRNVLQQNIYSIYTLCYDAGNVWMGTNDGLYCYNISQNHLARFDKGENTQGQVYYPLASMKGADGTLYFGGTDGFTAVDPRKISYNSYKPKAVISDFFIDYESVHPEYRLNDSFREIVLDYDQANFGFQFASDNYHISGKNRFKYRLRGYNDTWVTVDAQNRIAMYSKVPAGTYYFEVYTANNDGVWSEYPTIVKVVRRTAPWLSWPAVCSMLLIFVGGVYAVCRWKKKFKMLLHKERVERDKKERIHQAQIRFFTNISHDFRTPLSLIMAALDKLRREGLKEYYYRILNGNVQRLLNLANELMDFRTIESGMMKLELEQLDINRMVQEIGNDFTDYAKQRNIDYQMIFDKKLATPVYADKNVVEKIVMNLLNNAFKYTCEKGSIRLEIRGSDEAFVSKYENSFTVGSCGDNAFSLVVSDTGIGISAESISRVFEQFYKVNTDSYIGAGIGLALVKGLVLLQKGSITIYSERDKGTDLVVRLPLDTTIFRTSDFKKQQVEIPDVKIAETQKSDIVGSAEERFQNENKKKILLVEDDIDLRALIAEALADDFLVVQAGDGLEALRQMEELEFDLVISDIMMPNKDGVSLCNDIKKDLNTSHVPVVLLTAKTSLESKIEGAEFGADLYFEKPIDLTYLKTSLLNVFRNRQQLKEHYAKNYYADTSELVTNEQDNRFLKRFVDFIDSNMDQPQMNVNQIAEELGMSRSKLYSKVKSLTGKSVVGFVLNCRLRKAARLIIEGNSSMREIMMQVGIESQAYFTNSFKKVFGETPTSFSAKHYKTGENNL